MADVRGNQRYLQRQIHRLATALFGDHEIGPGQGSIVFRDSSERLTIALTPEDARIMQGGTEVSLPGELQKKAATQYVDEKDQAERNAREQGDIATLTSSKAYTRDQVALEADSRLRADTTVAQNAQSYADTAAGTAESHAKSYADSQDQVTLGSAKGYTNTQVSAEATARATGDTNAITAAKTFTSAQVAIETDARRRGDTSVATNAQNYADSVAGSAESRAKSAAQVMANTAEANARDAAKKQDNLLGIQIGTANTEISNLKAKVSSLERRIRTLEGNGL